MSSSASSDKRVLLPITNGSEEIEFASIMGALRRAGIIVDIASCTDKKLITGSRNVSIAADYLISEVGSTCYDAILLPGGGEGAKGFSNCPALIDLLKQQVANKKLYGAICASPAAALSPHGLILSNAAVGHPNFWSELKNNQGERLYSSQEELFKAPAVVYDEQNNCLTSLGPATGVKFGLYAVALLLGREKANEIAKAMMCQEWTVPNTISKL
jgi:4-methyl-5(b-hydroxyethyl)-thiazole monophosphate biosynthesis